jgi:hypothetical protein
LQTNKVPPPFCAERNTENPQNLLEGKKTKEKKNQGRGTKQTKYPTVSVHS